MNPRSDPARSALLSASETRSLARGLGWYSLALGAAELLAPCGAHGSVLPVSEASVATLAGTGGLAPARLLVDAKTASSRLTPWLLAIAALLLIAELAARRSTKGAQ